MKTTFSRSITSFAILTLSTLVLIGVAFRFLAKDFLTKKAVEDLQTEASVIVRLAQASYRNDSMLNHEFIISFSVATEASGNDAVLFGPKGTLELCSASPLGCEHQGMPLGEDYLHRILKEKSTVDVCILTGLYDDVRYVVAKPIFDADTGKHLGVVLVSSAVSTIQQTLNRIMDIFIFVSVLCVIFCVILMILLIRHQNNPLREMAQVARDFGHGNLGARVNTDGNNPQEVEELALAFNNMASSIEKGELQRREFVANVSHELKTPMTTIAGYVDGILDGTIPPERQQQYLQVVSDETKRLNRLVRSMLDVSRLQDMDGVPEEQKMYFDLCECVGQVLITFEQKIVAKGLDVQVEFPEHPVHTIAHKDLVTQVVYNLVDNGVKFSPNGGVLALKIVEGTTKVYISVTNDGPTIPAEELPLVFDRFHKIDKSRAQNPDSWGLGLYIVKTIIGAHGEDISVSSRDEKTTFTFTMPLVN